jgi:hypothetical protein
MRSGLAAFARRRGDSRCGDADDWHNVPVPEARGDR